MIGAGEAYKPACRECHVFFSKEREKGNLNINKIEDKDNKENMTPSKVKEIKEFSSSSVETSPSPNKEVCEKIAC